MRSLVCPRIALIVAVIAGSPVLAVAQPAAPPRAAGGSANRAAQLTLQLAREQLDVSAAPGNPGLVQRLANTAETRRRELVALIADDPAAFLRLALPASARAALPAQVQALVEQDAELEGDLEVLQEDYETSARLRYFLNTSRGRVGVHFAADSPKLQTGDRVRVRGVLLGAELAADNGTSSVTQVTSVAPYTFGEQSTLMILVNFQDLATQPFSVAAAHDLLFNTVNSFYRENSQNQTWLTGDVIGWFTIDLSGSVCDYAGIQSRARAAASAAGVNLANYRRFIYAFPQNACTWWGLGQVGGSQTHAWVNGNPATRVLGHELGHNLGLHHAHALECGTTTLGSSCSTIEYGDPADILGISGVVAHFNAFAKERLGWLNYGISAPILTVTGPGDFSLTPYADTQVVPKALKILKEVDAATGKKTWYYVEFRRGLNFDSTLAGNSNLANGVVVHTGSETNANSSFVLDMTPATSSWTDAALTVGNSFSDPVSGVNLTTLAASASSVSVNVGVATLACVPGTPTVSMTPTQTQWASAGAPLTWTVSVKNNDNAGCNAGSFAMGAGVPSGWTAAYSSANLVISPGQTAATTMQVTSSSDALDGLYPVQAASNNGTATGFASATHAVMAAYQVATTASVTASGKNRTLRASATVTANGAPVSGVTVSVSVRKSNGKVAVGSATTNASGVASYSLKLTNKDPIGTYTVTASATLNGITGSGTTTVDVR